MKKTKEYFMFLSIVVPILLFIMNSSVFGLEQVGLYDVFETQVVNSKSYSNPFDYTVIELQTNFVSPSGKEESFFGFYDGDGSGGQNGNVWKIRFMPDEVGTWNYTYTWTDGTPGGSGSFVVIDTGLSGPLQIASDNPWYFETLRGNPFHFRGYNMHVFMHWGEKNFNDSMDAYEAGVNAHVLPGGYNIVMILGPGYFAKSGHNWWYYNGSTTDLDRFEIRTWTNWDRLINYYRTRGLYIFPFSLIAQWDVNRTVGTSPARINRFQRYYVARSGAYWNLLGNSLTWEWPEMWSEATVTGWMSNPHNWNPSGTLLTSHDSMRSSFESWGGFAMRQRQSQDVFAGNSRTIGQHGGIQGPFVNKPIIGSEDIWESPSGTNGNPRNATEVRRGAWGALMAGVMPLYDEWSHGPTGGAGNGAGEPEVRRMFDFFYSKTRYRQYQQLNHLVSGSARQIASGIPEQEYLVYDENGGTITIDIPGTSSSDTFSVLWYDPKTGAEQNGANISGGTSVTLTSPFFDDTVLLLSTLLLDTIPPASPTSLEVN